MDKIKQLKKYFKDITLEKAFYKLLLFVDIYSMPVSIAITNLTEQEIIKLKIFYKCREYEYLIEALRDDIDYILEG